MRETRSCVRRFAMRLGQSSMALAILARETKRSRLLSLGTPIANRPDPVRVAEEMAWLDVLSGGRLEMGLVKGAPYEIAPANSNPANLMRRYWEAHDLILKAMSTTDGPFNWEGEFFHYRNVNIWPRPLQQPTPPVWMTGLSVETGRMAAERGHVVGTLLSLSAAGPMFEAYHPSGGRSQITHPITIVLAPMHPTVLLRSHRWSPSP